MAQTLENINEFLSYQTADSLPVSGNADPGGLSAYSQETVVIDSDGRNYELEIKFMNPDNVYIGQFFAIGPNGERINLLSLSSVVDSISANVDVIDKAYKVADTIISSNLTQAMKAQDSALSSAITNSYKAYVEKFVAENTQSNISLIEAVSSQMMRHINDASVHVKKDKTLQTGLNANYIQGYTATELLDEAVRRSSAGILSTIDCGLI